MSYEFDVLHADKHERLLQVDSIIFDWLGQTCLKYSGKFSVSLWHLKKEVRNEVRDLTAMADSNTALTIVTHPMFSHHVPFSSFNMESIPTLFFICDALHDLVYYVQFKKREKYQWKIVTSSKAAG